MLQACMLLFLSCALRDAFCSFSHGAVRSHAQVGVSVPRRERKSSHVAGGAAVRQAGRQAGSACLKVTSGSWEGVPYKRSTPPGTVPTLPVLPSFLLSKKILRREAVGGKEGQWAGGDGMEEEGC